MKVAVHVSILFGTLVVLAPVARADDAPAPAPAPTPVPAPEPAPSEAPTAPTVVGFAPEDYDLLPITAIQRDYLMRDHGDLVTRATLLGKRAERIQAQLKE